MQLTFPLFPGRSAKPDNGKLVVSCANEAYEVTLKRHPRARRYTLRVRDRGREIVMTIPPRGSLREARDFAQRNAAWIAARLKRIPEPVAFVHGATIPLRGVPTRIEHRPEARGTVWTETAADGSALLCVAGGPAHVSRRVADFLKREARRELVAAARHYARALGVGIGHVSIRDTASRWGSCSHEGSLSFSWRLILAPPFVLDYLAAHEVAHRRELNHSARFWRIVDQLAPERRRAETWLRTQGNSLHRYGVAA